MKSWASQMPNEWARLIPHMTTTFQPVGDIARAAGIAPRRTGCTLKWAWDRGLVEWKCLPCPRRPSILESLYRRSGV